jgi:hypothetical protein
MDIHIHSIDKLKDGELSPKSKGKTFRVEGTKPEFFCTDTYLLITGQSSEDYHNQSSLLGATTPDREITRTAKVFISKSEIICLLKCAVESELISKNEILECVKSVNV